jgi:hypothetical protein
MQLTFGSLKQIFGFFDEFFDVVARSLQLFFVRMQRIAKVGRVLETIGELQRQKTHLEQCLDLNFALEMGKIDQLLKGKQINIQQVVACFEIPPTPLKAPILFNLFTFFVKIFVECFSS